MRNFFLNYSITALTVRYLTKRFIGEYHSKTDLLYRQTISLDSGLLDVEIVDVSDESDNDFPIEQIQWADACLIVYSITDRKSFQYATRTLGTMKSIQNNPSTYLIANKSDLDHLREVSLVISSYENIRSWPVASGKHYIISIDAFLLATSVLLVPFMSTFRTVYILFFLTSHTSHSSRRIVRLPTNGQLNNAGSHFIAFECIPRLSN